MIACYWCIRTILEGQSTVQIGSRTYHKDCLDEREKSYIEPLLPCNPPQISAKPLTGPNA